MDDNRTLESLEYRILDISTTQFAVFMSEAEAILDMDQLNMNSSFSYGVDATEKLFSSKIDIVVYNRHILSAASASVQYMGLCHTSDSFT